MSNRPKKKVAPVKIVEESAAGSLPPMQESTFTKYLKQLSAEPEKKAAEIEQKAKELGYEKEKKEKKPRQPRKKKEAAIGSGPTPEQVVDAQLAKADESKHPDYATASDMVLAYCKLKRSNGKSLYDTIASKWVGGYTLGTTGRFKRVKVPKRAARKPNVAPAQ